MLRNTVSEKDVHDAVAALREIVQGKYDQALRHGHHEWLVPPERFTPTMKNLQRAMSPAVFHETGEAKTTAKTGPDGRKPGARARVRGPTSD